MQKVVYRKATQYLTDLMIPIEHLHVHGNEQLLPRTRIDILKMSLSFSLQAPQHGTIYLELHFKYSVNLKTLSRKAFQALINSL